MTTHTLSHREGGSGSGRMSVSGEGVSERERESVCGSVCEDAVCEAVDLTVLRAPLIQRHPFQDFRFGKKLGE